MAAPVLPLQAVKLPPGPSSLTPEQTYWRTFKSQLQIPSPSNSPITHISTPSAAANALARPSEQFAVTTGTRVQIFSIRTRKLLKQISRFDDVAHGAEIRPDGRVMVAGDETGAVQVFDVNSRAILKTWKEHNQPVWSIKWSPTDPTQLLSASDDRTLRLWDLPSDESVTKFVGHQDYVRSAAFMPGQASGLFLSGSYDQTVRLWDPRTPTSSVMTFKHSAPVEAALPMPTGTTILAAADDQISILDLVAAKPLTLLKNHQKTVTSLSLASNNTRLVSGGLDGHLKVFETTGWNVVSGSKYPSPILSLCIIPSSTGDDRHIAVGQQSGILSLKTRLSGPQKSKERARQKEMQALLEGRGDDFDKRQAKKEKTKKKQQQKKRPPTSGWEKRTRGQDFTGEGADIVIADRPRSGHHKPKPWEALLRKGQYDAALDAVLALNHLSSTITLLTALRHRSAMRAALSGRDESTLQPVFRWICTYMTNPRYVSLCTDLGLVVLELYAEHMGESRDVDRLRERLHEVVRREVERSQQAGQTEGMLGLVMGGVEG